MEGSLSETPWEPGKVIPIQKANTSADETFPFFANNALDLYFTRRTSRGDEIFCVRRSTGDGDFQLEAKLKLATSEPHNSSASFSADGLYLVFGREKSGQSLIFESVRSAASAPFTTERQLSFENVLSPQGDPFLTEDGLHLLMSAGLGKFTKMEWPDRTEPTGDFHDPYPLKLEGPFRRPSITRDLCTIYMEGVLPDSRPGIYRSMRQSIDSPWSPPLAVDEIRPADGSGSDFSPRISDDGTLLLFSSNRDGGSGGKDLYAYLLKEPPTATWPVDSGIQSPPEPAEGWLILGPIPMGEVERIQSLAELMRRYFPSRDRRDLPHVGDKIADIPWRGAETPFQEKRDFT